MLVGGAVRVRPVPIAVGEPAACCRVYVLPPTCVMYEYQPVAPAMAGGDGTVTVDVSATVVTVPAADATVSPLADTYVTFAPYTPVSTVPPVSAFDSTGAAGAVPAADPCSASPGSRRISSIASRGSSSNDTAERPGTARDEQMTSVTPLIDRTTDRDSVTVLTVPLTATRLGKTVTPLAVTSAASDAAGWPR